MAFILSKVLWVFTSPGNLLVLILTVGAFLSVSLKENRRLVGRSICFYAALVLFFISVCPVGVWMLAPLENRVPPQYPDHVAGIILLGGDEKPDRSEARKQPVFLDSGRRYIMFAAMARRYPQAKLVFTGGSPLLTPLNATMKDADVAKQALMSIGVPVDRMLFEDKSRNTHENAMNSFDLVKPKPDETWLLVTSAFHMPRALATFRKAGWNVQPATTGYLTDGGLAAKLDFNLGEHVLQMAWATHEYYGLLAYRLMGYTDQLWPESSPSP
jgi:uncharacterized SAM-binding protein YcdF (DUF218 family)